MFPICQNESFTNALSAYVTAASAFRALPDDLEEDTQEYREAQRRLTVTYDILLTSIELYAVSVSNAFPRPLPGSIAQSEAWRGACELVFAVSAEFARVVDAEQEQTDMGRDVEKALLATHGLLTHVADLYAALRHAEALPRSQSFSNSPAKTE